MRKTIAFSNSKGGTGKSTLCGTVGYKISKLNSVLLIDTDPQGNLSSWYIRDNIQYELSDVLSQKANLTDAIFQVRDNLYILPTLPTSGELNEYAETKLYRERYAFQDLIDAASTMGFEFVLFDLSPGTHLLERSAIAVCDEVVTPIQLEYFSFDGWERFFNELEKIERENRVRIIHNKIVMNMVNENYRRHKVYRSLVGEYDVKLYTIPQSAKVAEAQTTAQTIFEYHFADKTIPEFERLSNEIIKSNSGILV